MPAAPVSARQISASLALLGLTAADLAARSGLSEVDVAAAEMGAANDAQLHMVRSAIERAGIEFLNGGSPGVRLRGISEGLMPDQLNASNDG